jgi:dolichol-phosphate mannosyltransferase
MLPTYNEAENIESLIREIQSLNLDLTIAVIDDSSPDGTADVVRKLQKRNPGRVHLVSRSEKLGLGTAITDGFRYLLSLKRPPRYIIAMDADYSHNPRDIPRLLVAARRGYDLVIGSRYSNGGKVVGSSLKRRLISRFANLIAALAVGSRTNDCTSGFRCYSKHYVKNVLPNLHSQTYEIQIETVKQARMNKFRVKEIPITFVDRKKGKSKLSIAEIQGFLTYILKATLNRLIP